MIIYVYKPLLKEASININEMLSKKIHKNELKNRKPCNDHSKVCVKFDKAGAIQITKCAKRWDRSGRKS